MAAGVNPEEPAARPDPEGDTGREVDAGASAGNGALLRAALKTWTTQLVDMGGRNTLLYFRDQRAGTLDLTEAYPLFLDSLLAGRSVRISSMLPTEAARIDAIRRARAIYRKARENFEERGITTLHLACGLASWHTERDGRPPRAPVLLRSATLVPRGAAQEEFELALTGEMEISPTLLRVLESDFGCRLDPGRLLDIMDQAIDTRGELQEAYDWLVAEASAVKGMSVEPRLALGNFSYAKLPMVSDLERSGKAMAQHQVIMAIVGDRTARDALTARYREAQVAPDGPERMPPEKEFLVLDADSSQSRVIDSVLAGQDIIVRGPPGTGKSQTISNLIASAIAHGLTVLFVAEKRAAIEAVAKRLTDPAVGLGEMILDLHGGAGRRRDLAAALGRSLELVRSVPLVTTRETSEKLLRARETLARHVAALHEPRDPWGISLHEAHVRATAVPARQRTDLRFAGPLLETLGREKYSEARSDLRSLGELRAFEPEMASSPWREVTPEGPEHALELFGTVDRLGGRSIPAARRHFEGAADETGLGVEPSLAGWRSAAGAWQAARDALSTLAPDVFSPELPQLAVDHAPAGRSYLRRLLAGVFDARYSRARSRVKALLIDPATTPQVSHRAVSKAAAAWAAWQSGATAAAPQGGAAAADPPRVPRVPSDLDAVMGALQGVEQGLAEHPALAGVLDLRAPATAPLSRLEAALEALRSARASLVRLPAINEARGRLEALGLGELLTELDRANLDTDGCLALLEHAWCRSIIDRIEFSDRRVGDFDAQRQWATVSEFGVLDRTHIRDAAGRIRRLYAERAVAARDRHPEQAALIARQAALKRRHLPLRDLFGQATDVMLALKPVWAMSPLVVSQLLPSDRRFFDLVVFDEASQITPSDAIPAILRGQRLVVTGDERQLPPTAFFLSHVAETDAEEEALLSELAVTRDFESILDALSSLLPTTTLRWHYRSRDERLIAFSNLHFYDRSLTTFPGTSRRAIEHVLVPFREGRMGQEESVADEVDRVVDLVLDHATRRPHQSLGVIAMGITHANRLEEALREALRERPDLDGFFEVGAEDPFFIKNLERVQGDERDAIILSVGYGKTADGRLLHRFGPINMAGGERRLNVAITRARSRMTVVSSFASQDIDPQRTSALGPRLLAEYLRYAESGGDALTPGRREEPEVDALGVAVGEDLARAGLALEPRLGTSGYRIDFAVRHPERPDEYVLAIDMDGADYRATPTTRDRDRLRQQHLERLGWSFHRAWTSQWFANRPGALAAALEAARTAVAAADRKAQQAAQEVAKALSAQQVAVVGASFTTGASPAEPPPGMERTDADPEPGRPALPAAPARGPRPRVGRGRSIGEYALWELVALVDWVESDGLLRTQEELITELMRELGYRRRGQRIVATLSAAISAARTARARRAGPGPG